MQGQLYLWSTETVNDKGPNNQSLRGCVFTWYIISFFLSTRLEITAGPWNLLMHNLFPGHRTSPVEMKMK